MSTTTTRRKKKSIDELPTDYADLLAMHPPRVPHSKADAEAIAAVLARLGGRKLNADQVDYATLLGRLYAEWRTTNGPKRKKATHGQIVRALLDEHEMNQTQMAGILGITQGHVSQILAGNRDLSKESLRKLADRFKLDAGALL